MANRQSFVQFGCRRRQHRNSPIQVAVVLVALLSLAVAASGQEWRQPLLPEYRLLQQQGDQQQRRQDYDFAPSSREDYLAAARGDLADRLERYKLKLAEQLYAEGLSRPQQADDADESLGELDLRQLADKLAETLKLQSSDSSEADSLPEVAEIEHRFVGDYSNNPKNPSYVVLAPQKQRETEADDDLANGSINFMKRKSDENNDAEPVDSDKLAERSTRPPETTLLEADEEKEASELKSANTTSSQLADTTASQTGVSGQPTNLAGERTQKSPTGSSLFDRVYSKLASYLPLFDQINILNRLGGGGGNSTEAANKTLPEAKKEKEDKRESGANTKLGVSKVAAELGNDDKQEVEEEGNGKKKVVSVRVQENSDKTDSFGSLGEFEATKKQVDSKQPIKKRVHVNSEDLTLEADDDEDDDDNRRVDRVNLVRSGSNLLVPVGEHPTLVGNYIFAPASQRKQQRYYLSSAAAGEDDDSAPVYSHVLHRSRTVEPLGPTFETLKPAYAFHKDGTMSLLLNESSANKTNDAYFLVMVGAFCVMAMAIVLAAGLFAYRVQQSRKSSQEVEYPTYGVVGPNSKCGAAAFVGGYFGANGPPPPPPLTATGSPGSFGGKSAGSAKHLADFYANCNDSGIACSEKGTSTASASKKASAASSLAEQQQAAGRATPSPNVFAASQDAARMYHYQQQKQQMISADRNSAGRHTSASDLDSEEENDDGSYTVYECPGLASAHEMEIKNPLFNDDRSP